MTKTYYCNVNLDNNQSPILNGWGVTGDQLLIAIDAFRKTQARTQARIQARTQARTQARHVPLIVTDEDDVVILDETRGPLAFP